MHMFNVAAAQSGGPTAAINASLAGVVAAARDFGIYDKIYGAIHGIQGVLKKHFLDLSDKDDAFIHRLARTPAMYLGSCRFKLPDMSEEEQLKLLATNGMLVKRPLLITEDKVLIGFREAEWEEKLE